MGTLFSKILSLTETPKLKSYNENTLQIQTMPSYPEYNCIRLNNFLLLNILGYIDPKTIISQYLTLSKPLNALVNLKPFTQEMDFDHYIGGIQDMDELYCEFDLSEMAKGTRASPKTLLDIYFEIESKDQGWSSVRASSSWVELRLVQRNDKNSVLSCCDLVRNFRERVFRNTKVSLFKDLGNVGKKLLELIKNENPLLQVYGRSMYPGWVCYMRKVKARFLFYEINLG